MKLSFALGFFLLQHATALPVESDHDMLRRNEETASTKRKLQTIPLVQPFCLDFNDAPNLDGFDKCPGIYDNIQVKHSTVQTNGDPQDHSEPGDGYIHLRDLSGGSIACAEAGPLIGDWSEVACQANCYELCYDFNLFYDGCQNHNTNCVDFGPGGDRYIPRNPSIVFQGGPPNYYRAVIVADFTATDSKGPNPGWHRVCVPLGTSGTDLPVKLPHHNAQWRMATAPCDYTAGVTCFPGSDPTPDEFWCDLMSDVHAIVLPIDFTGNPAERAGYDNICIERIEGCGDSSNDCDADSALEVCACTNTAGSGGVDDGCQDFPDHPICVDHNGHELSAGVDGSYCAVCINTQMSDLVADQGCPDDKPQCVIDGESPALWHAGACCQEVEHECWNTAPHGAQDDGCDPETPICVGPGGKEIDDACYGEACVTCVNSEQADTVADYGCSDETPMCLLEEDGDAPPLSKPGNFCQGPSGDVCINDKVNGAKDENCKDNKPLCVKHDGSVAWLHTQGDKCVRCVNTFLYNSAHMVDEGCGPSAPCCVESYGGSAPAVGYAGAACMANAD